MRLGNAILALASFGALAYLFNFNSRSSLESDIDASSIQEVTRALAPKSNQSNGGPNIIYIQHESLSGSILLNTEKGRASTPFLQSRMANDSDLYVFEHHRTGSGNTIDAMPSLMTGCLPYTEKGMEYAYAKGRSIGYEFADMGYSTASFSSRELDDTIKEGQWSLLYDMLVGGMDRVESATTNKKLEVNNGQGSSDWQMLPLFEDWLDEVEKQEEDELMDPTQDGLAKRPFYAQFYNFNQHFPYLNSRNKPKIEFTEKEGDDYYRSLGATDDFLEALFDLLSSTGRLENTIIIGSGDHGEDPFRARYARLNALTSHILHSASYIYYPKHLMPHEGIGERLRRNTQQLSYTLDMYPTIRSILHSLTSGGDVAIDNNSFGFGYDQNSLSDLDTAAAEGCLTGIDLTSVDVPEDRVALATNLPSSYIMPSKKNLRLYALITKDAALYHRKHEHMIYALHQGSDDWYVLEFGSCTQDIDAFCSKPLDDESEEYFRRAMVALRSGGSGFIGKGAKWSHLVKFFVKILGGEIAIKKTGQAMEFEHSMVIGGNLAGDLMAESIALESLMTNSADTNVVDEDPLRGIILDPSSEGLLLDIVHSVQKKMSWWN